MGVWIRPRSGNGMKAMKSGLPGPPGTVTVRGMAVLALTLGLLVAPVSPQTVEQRYEPFATGAVTTIYPGKDALGATDLADLLLWYVPGASVHRFQNGVTVGLRGGAVNLREPGGFATEVAKRPEGWMNPLIIVDGFKVSNEDFSWRLLSLSPFTVERIVVLRDLASTTVYGTRGSRGVILVFTRRR